MKRFIILAGLILLVFLASLSLAGIPKMINYQGMLIESDGTTPVADGTYNLGFKIYGSESGTDSLWWESHSNVQVTNGLFNVILGSQSALNLLFDADYWLEIIIGTEIMPTRLRFTSVGYAYRALVADSAAVAGSGGGGWVDDGTVVRLETSTDKVGIGTTQPKVRLDVGDMMRVQGLNYPTYPSTGKGLELAYKPSDNTGFIQVYDRDASSWGKLYLGNGEVGIGTGSPGVKLQIAGGTDVDDETENSGYLIVGSSTGSHIAFDNNEIMAKASGTSVGNLSIQHEGGTTNFGGDVNIDGKINGAVGLVAMGSYNNGSLTENLNVDSVVSVPVFGVYYIYLTGITYHTNNYVTIVTPKGNVSYFVSTSSGSGMLLVYFHNKDGDKELCNHFRFVVYNKE